jgi:WD40 repeat protein
MKRTWIKLALLAIALLLYACAGSPTPKPTASVSNVAPRCEKLNESAFTYADLGLQPSAVAHSPIAALTFSPDNRNLLIAYTFAQPDIPGELVQVRISDHQPVRSVSLARLTPGLTLFTEEGDRILSAAPKTCPDKTYYAQDTCWDVWGWNTTTGQLVDVPNGFNAGLTDIALSGDGKWLLKIGGLLGSLHNLDLQNVGATLTEDIDGMRRKDITGALTKQANLVALGIKDETWGGEFVAGWLRLEQWDGKTIKRIDWDGWRIRPPDLTGEGLKVDGVPLRLAFDPLDHWLAAQTSSSIYVFDVPSLGAIQRSVNFAPTRLGVPRFNPSGSLLAAGHLQGLRVLSVPDLKTVLDKPGSEVTTIAFSIDGCMLAWGDVEGTVHIINAPKP